MNHLAHTRPTKTFIFRHLHEKCSRQNVQFFTVHFHIFFLVGFILSSSFFAACRKYDWDIWANNCHRVVSVAATYQYKYSWPRMVWHTFQHQWATVKTNGQVAN